MKKINTAAQLLGELTDTMAQWEGEDIAAKAEEILGHPVKYLEDSLFEINEDETSTETICCDNCGHEYDRHIGDYCPNCGHNTAESI